MRTNPRPRGAAAKAAPWASFSSWLVSSIYFFFVRSSEAGQITTFGLNPGPHDHPLSIADLTLPVLTSLYVMAVLSVSLGVFQISRDCERGRRADPRTRDR